MALYQTGTASLAANGIVTGVGTNWTAPLSLIRKGNTMILNKSVFVTIDAIISPTSMRVIAPSGVTSPNAQYVIMTTDALSVDGLAQDVAETLRYWQAQANGIESSLASAWRNSKPLSGSINVLFDEGTYYQSSNSGATVGNGYPSESPYAGSLMVLKNYANGVNGCTQVYYPYNNSYIYSRSYSPSSNEWGEWRRQFLSGETLNFDSMPQNQYDYIRLSTGQTGGKLYMRKFRGGNGESIFHETLQGGTYRIAAGTSDTTDFVSFDFKGTGNTEGKLGGKVIALESNANVKFGSGLGVENTWDSQTYVTFSIKNNGKIGNTSLFGIEIPNTENLRAYFLQRERTGTANQIVNALPSTGGALAVQGTSGINFKKNIVDADSSEALNRVMGLELKNFVYKDDDKNRVRFGFIAEQGEKIAPQYVKHNQELYDEIKSIDEHGEEKVEKLYRDRPSIDNNPIVMDLIGCIHALKYEIDELKKALASK